MSDAQIEKMVTSEWGDSQKFVRGKSLVGGTVAGDIFENITADPIAFEREAVSSEANRPELSVELAGPWSFYADFRRAHGLNHLPHPEPPEIALQVGTTLVIPLWVLNPTSAAQEIALAADLPTGWVLQSGVGKFSIGAKQTAAARIEIALPASADAVKKSELQEVTLRAEAGGKSIGTVKLRVELRKRSLPQ